MQIVLLLLTIFNNQRGNGTSHAARMLHAKCYARRGKLKVEGQGARGALRSHAPGVFRGHRRESLRLLPPLRLRGAAGAASKRCSVTHPILVVARGVLG